MTDRRRGMGVALAHAALAGLFATQLACGVVKVNTGPLASLGGESSTDAPADPPAAQDVQADWDGAFDSTFGRVELTQTSTKAWSGTYPGGTLNCLGEGLDLRCDWADNTGSGRAKFHWDTTKRMSGTFGNGPSDTDQGEWTLTWPATSTSSSDSESSGSGSSSSSSSSSGSSSSGSSASSGCKRDSDCRSGTMCESGACIAKVGVCSLDSDCGGARCSNSRCANSQYGRCDLDSHCGKGGKCSSHRCK